MPDRIGAPTAGLLRERLLLWLLLNMDHVIPTKECERLRLRVAWHHSFSNIVLAYSGYNTFDNGYKVSWQRPKTAEVWTEDGFTALRDKVFRVFEERRARILERRAHAVRFFKQKIPWGSSLPWIGGTHRR